ncbi:MAG: PIG-L family deacetylase [Candidatus Chromulinivorax sp.]|nr:PIG-L family deacetylase [Candidatus Chromulinivorax sp.]
MTPQQVIQDIEQKIAAGFEQIHGKTIVHTAPHHDDILLGYFPYLLRNLAGNMHHVVYMTSGANGVSDRYLAEHASMTHEHVAQLDAATKQELKYRIREAESEKKWALAGGQDHIIIKHVRAEFYEVNEQDMDDAMQRDVQRMVAYLNAVQPDIITMLVDPIGIGPASHHRTEFILRAAIAQCHFSQHVTIIGYRNVWSTFTCNEASMIVLVTQGELDQMESIFSDCFRTQVTKLIAGDELKNFAQEVAEIQKAQYQEVMNLLGRSAEKYPDYQAAIFLQQLDNCL